MAECLYAERLRKSSNSGCEVLASLATAGKGSSGLVGSSSAPNLSMDRGVQLSPGGPTTGLRPGPGPNLEMQRLVAQGSRLFKFEAAVGGVIAAGEVALVAGGVVVTGLGSYVVYQVITASPNPVQYLGPIHNTIYGTDNNPVPNSVTIQQGFTFKEGEYRDNDGNIRAFTTGKIVKDKAGNGIVATPNCD